MLADGLDILKVKGLLQDLPQMELRLTLVRLPARQLKKFWHHLAWVKGSAIPKHQAVKPLSA
jgi:hypothetical protein